MDCCYDCNQRKIAEMDLQDSINTDCVFCQILNHKEPATFFYQGNSVTAFKDIYKPQPHALIIPNMHVESIKDLFNPHLKEIFNEALDAVVDILGLDGFIIEAHDVVHQSIPHVHFHVHDRPEIR